MGYSTSQDIADSGLTLESQLHWHLVGNHFPPIPTSMIPVCIEAINAYNSGDGERLISLPDGVGYKGLTVAPADEIIVAHHLDAWIEYDYED